MNLPIFGVAEGDAKIARIPWLSGGYGYLPGKSYQQSMLRDLSDRARDVLAGHRRRQ